MSGPPVTFDHVTKSFVRGRYHDSLRDLLGNLIRPGSSKRKKDWFNAVDDVSFEVAEGEALGIIGPNGSGKSTVLKLLTGIYVPTSGEVCVRGRTAPLIEVGAGFHPDLTGRENIYLNGAISGMSRAEIKERFDDIVEFSGIGAFLDTPVKRYSSGMYMRLGFSIASHTPSEILVVDEVLAVGDVGFRTRCLERMKRLKREGRTILFVSHSGHQVRTMCDRVIYLLEGKKVFDGDTIEGTQTYEHDVLTGRVGQRAAKGAAEGDRPAGLQEARVLHEASDSGIVLKPGDGVDVLVRYTIDRPMEEPPVLSVGFLSPDGIIACALTSRDQEFSLETEPGSYSAVARFDRLPLFPRKYSVEVQLWDAEMVVVLDQISAAGVEFLLETKSRMNRHCVFFPEGRFTAEDE